MSKPDFFLIDPNALDREWIAQPALYHEYATKLADAKRAAEQAKTAVDVVWATVETAVRETPAKYGIEKVTEAAVKAAVSTHRKYAAAIQAAIDAKHAVDILQAAVNTLDHRKRALENLVDLRLADYFSEPRNKPRGDKEKAATRRAGRPMDSTEDSDG
jgi:DNA repair ATPase RecN